MSKKSIILDVIKESPNRRSLLRKIGMASVAAGATWATGGLKLNADPTAPTAIDVLQFALNLEYLEAEFYTMATAGTTIDMPPYNIGISGSGTPGPTTGGNQVSFGNNLVLTGAVALEIAADERAHVSLLRSALSANGGPGPIAKPAINLNALGIGFANELSFLLLARVFEDIGVTAYAGGTTVPALASSPYLTTAAQILATEAEHVGNIRLQIARLAIDTTATKLDSVDILPPPAGTNFISADNTGLTQLRTPGQVLYLAYGNAANATSGGFFPQGVNGNLHTSSSSPA